MQTKKSFLMLSLGLAVAGTWYMYDLQGLAQLAKSGTDTTQPEWVQEQHSEAVEEVEGVNGMYPKRLTTEDLVQGKVSLPEGPDPQDQFDQKAEAWAKVDFDLLRSELPSNKFWDMVMPTSDAAVLEQRKAKREALKKTETRMMARHASEEEIRDYYAYQQSLSEDYVEATTLLLNKYSDVLPEEDVSGQRLARTMHLSKLQEIPSQMTRAIEQRQAFLEEKSEWMADKAGYRANLEAEVAEANRALGKI